MKAILYAQLESGIDVTLEAEAEDRAGLEAAVNSIIANLKLGPRGAVNFGSGVKVEEPKKPEGPLCDCGSVMQYREGTSKTGKPYKGWFCSKPQSQCPPMWLND